MTTTENKRGEIRNISERNNAGKTAWNFKKRWKKILRNVNYWQNGQIYINNL